MIEVEKKVVINEEQLKVIEQTGTFLGTKMITDTYYDTPAHRFTRSDIWLRERNCQFELKIGIRGTRGSIDYYEEISDPVEIMKQLGLENQRDLQKGMAKLEMIPYATLQTIRRKYQLEEFSIDLDLAYFDDFIYRIAEIETQVNSEEQIPDAHRAIEKFLKSLGLSVEKPVQAKLIALLAQKNRSHYNALVEAGVVG